MLIALFCFFCVYFCSFSSRNLLTPKTGLPLVNFLKFLRAENNFKIIHSYLKHNIFTENTYIPVHLIESVSTWQKSDHIHSIAPPPPLQGLCWDLSSLSGVSWLCDQICVWNLRHLLFCNMYVSCFMCNFSFPQIVTHIVLNFLDAVPCG